MSENEEVVNITQVSDNLTADRMGLRRLFDAMEEKLYAKHLEGRGGWHNDCGISYLEQLLSDHINKDWTPSNLVDIANFCMMLWNRRNPVGTAAALSRSASGPSEEEISIARNVASRLDAWPTETILARAVLRMAGK